MESLKNIFFSFFKSPNKEVLKEVKLMFPQKEITFTDMGRTAFKLIIEEMKLENSQMLFPAYICDTFFPIFKKYNISPVFLDIQKETFHIKFEDIKKKITPKTKSILVCHTYGLPVDIQKIKQFINNQLLIIEDCAHSFGVKYGSTSSSDGIYTGNLGKAALFSLYKQFPCLRGGMAVLQKKPETSLLKTRFNFRDLLSLLNNFGIFAFLFKKFGGKIAPKIQREEKFEKIGSTNSPQIGKINNVSLNLFLNYLKDFKENLKKRIELAFFFQGELRKLGFEVQESKDNTFSFLSVLAPKNLNRDKFVKKLRKYGIFCTRIWHTPIILNSEVQKEYNLNLDEFPNTVDVAKRIVNFPLQNHYSKKDIKKTIKLVAGILLSS